MREKAMANLDLQQLSPALAQHALTNLVSGEPPAREILSLISVGLDRDMRTFEREYFRPGSFVTSDETLGSTFKIVEAYYGGGKTHYLRLVEQTAHKHGFVTAFVGLKKDECPLTRFDRIYSAVTEALTIPGGDSTKRGFANLIRHWVEERSRGQEDPFDVLDKELDSLGDLPLMGLKVALRHAVTALLADDLETFEETLVYLTSGKIPQPLRRYGILQPIDTSTGSLALRTLAALIRKLGFAGFVLMLDEGDRSLSIVSSKDRRAASNNLVQLINETASAGAWPSTVLLYSIPSWAEFQDAFQTNQALIQRTETTGFPLTPPATRIVLEDRLHSHAAKKEFCIEVADRLTRIYKVAYPDNQLNESVARETAETIADQLTSDPSFRRRFIQEFISALYKVSD